MPDNEFPRAPRDKAEHEAMGTANDCDAVLDGWACTRRSGHDGDHVCAGMETIHARWPSTPSAPAAAFDYEGAWNLLWGTMSDGSMPNDWVKLSDADRSSFVAWLDEVRR